jgi:hypothetical protein
VILARSLPSISGGRPDRGASSKAL